MTVQTRAALASGVILGIVTTVFDLNWPWIFMAVPLGVLCGFLGRKRA